MDSSTSQSGGGGVPVPPRLAVGSTAITGPAAAAAPQGALVYVQVRMSSSRILQFEIEMDEQRV